MIDPAFAQILDRGLPDILGTVHLKIGGSFGDGMESEKLGPRIILKKRTESPRLGVAWHGKCSAVVVRQYDAKLT